MVEKKIIGIDPGLAGTGVGVVSGSFFNVSQYSFGSIETDSSLSLPDRLKIIYNKIHALIAGEKPDRVVVEDIFILNKYPKSAIVLGKVSGVISLAASENGVEVLEVSVKEAKKILTGSGNADKNQLERSVRNVLSHHERIKPFHASDALALSLIGLYRCEMEHG